MSRECSNVTWAANNGTTVDWARGMWTCMDDCEACRNWPETVDVGHVHVLTEAGGSCVQECPHPDHSGVTA